MNTSSPITKSRLFNIIMFGTSVLNLLKTKQIIIILEIIILFLGVPTPLSNLKVPKWSEKETK